MKKRACLLAAAFSIFIGMEAYGGQFIKDETGLKCYTNVVTGVANKI